MRGTRATTAAATRPPTRRKSSASKRSCCENFQERIQIKRGLCELEAQNQLNEMEIRQDQEMLMRYTLSKSGKLIAKENCEDLEEFLNLPPTSSGN